MRSWDYLRGDCISAAAKQVSHNDISKATKDPVNPVNQPQGPQHPTMRWPYSVIGTGGCTDPRWVASFTKVSFVNQSATGDPWKKSLSNLACVFGESILSRNTRPNLHWLTPLWTNTLEGLNYSSYEQENSTVSEYINYYSCGQRNQCRFSLFDGLKMCPADYTKNRLSHRTILRRLYSTFVTSSENKAI